MLSGSALLGTANPQPPPPDRPAEAAPVMLVEHDAEPRPVTPAPVPAPVSTSQSQQTTTSNTAPSSNTLATNTQPTLTQDPTEDTASADRRREASAFAAIRPTPPPEPPPPEPPPPEPPPPEPTGDQGGSHRSGGVEEAKEGPANPRSLSNGEGLVGAVGLAALADASPGTETAANEPSSPVDPALSPNARVDGSDAEGQLVGAATLAAQARPGTADTGGHLVGATTFLTELVLAEEAAALPSVDDAALLGLSLPANLAALDAALASFLSGLDQLADNLPGPDHPAYWVLAVTLALTACEIGRRQLRRVDRTAVPAWL